jgi:hypothetical protein
MITTRYDSYCMHDSIATRLFDDHNSHFGSLEIRFFHPKKAGVEGINNILMSNNGYTYQSAQEGVRGRTTIFNCPIPDFVENRINPLFEVF